MFKIGFFENRAAVLANDAVMRYQRKDYGNVEGLNVPRAARDVLESGGGASLRPGEGYAPRVGRRGWKFDFKEAHAPLSHYAGMSEWMQKDPRMCLTMPVWFPFFERPPAVVWTYRHPLEVAKR